MPSLQVQHIPEASGVWVFWQVEFPAATSEQEGVQEHVAYSSSENIALQNLQRNLTTFKTSKCATFIV